MELVETICKFKSEEDEVHLHLMTVQDDYKMDDQEDHFKTIKDVCLSQGVLFTWEYDQSNTIHARHIECDNGWKILLDRGLDIYQYFEMKNIVCKIDVPFRNCIWKCDIYHYHQQIFLQLLYFHLQVFVLLPKKDPSFERARDVRVR